MNAALTIYWLIAAVLMLLATPAIYFFYVWGNKSGDLKKNLTAIGMTVLILLACVFWFPVLISWIILQPSQRTRERMFKDDELRRNGY